MFPKSTGNVDVLQKSKHHNYVHQKIAIVKLRVLVFSYREKRMHNVRIEVLEMFFYMGKTN